MTSKTPWPFSRVIAHRGSGTMAPENTLEGFRVGLRHGYKAMETDAMLARDGVPILMHDEKFGRTILNDPRSVPELTSYEVRTLDAGSWFAPQFTGVPPAGFEQAMRWARANGVWFNIEVKPAEGYEYETGRVVGEITKRLFADQIRPGGDVKDAINPEAPIFSSFARESLRGVIETCPDLPRGLLTLEIPEDWREALAEYRCVSLNCDEKTVTKEFAREVKDLGYWLCCWTVSDPVRARELFSWGVDAIFTDRLDVIRPCF